MESDQSRLKKFIEYSLSEERITNQDGDVVAVKPKKWFIIPLMILEIIVTATLMALNYLFRYGKFKLVYYYKKKMVVKSIEKTI